MDGNRSGLDRISRRRTGRRGERERTGGEEGGGGGALGGGVEEGPRGLEHLPGGGHGACSLRGGWIRRRRRLGFLWCWSVAAAREDGDQMGGGVCLPVRSLARSLVTATPTN